MFLTSKKHAICLKSTYNVNIMTFHSLSTIWIHTFCLIHFENKRKNHQHIVFSNTYVFVINSRSMAVKVRWCTVCAFISWRFHDEEFQKWRIRHSLQRYGARCDVLKSIWRASDIKTGKQTQYIYNFPSFL